MNKPSTVPWSLVTIILSALAWEIAARFWIRNYALFPPVASIAMALLDMLRNGDLMRDTAASLSRVAAGFVTGSLAGVVLGVLTGKLDWLRATAGRAILFVRSIPAIALVPLVILWFGIGELAKVFLVFWGVLFPVWINAFIGSTAVERQYIWAAKSLGASDVAVLWRVIIPRAVPFVLAGLRTGLGLGFITLIAAEMTGASSGLGYRLVVSELVFRADRVIADLIVLGLLGFAADSLFVVAAKAYFPWTRLNNTQDK